MTLAEALREMIGAVQDPSSFWNDHDPEGRIREAHAALAAHEAEEGEPNPCTYCAASTADLEWALRACGELTKSCPVYQKRRKEPAHEREREEVCEWKRDSDFAEWTPSCDDTKKENHGSYTPLDAGYCFCPFCGKAIHLTGKGGE